MKKRNIFITIVLSLILILSLCVIAYAGYQLTNINLAYVEGDRNYEDLRRQVIRQPNDNRGNTDADLDVFVNTSDRQGEIDADRGSAMDIPRLSVDFDALSRINPDTAAWLYSPNTPIDNPVVNASDYDKYLHQLPDGTRNANGTLFFDNNCEPDLGGRLSIIYGHNMRSGKMFGSLVEYKDQAYFENHPYMYLYTKEKNYRIDLKYGCVIGAGEWRDRAFMYELNLDALLSYAATNTTFRSNTKYSENDKFIVLSTCSYEFDDARYFVVGVLRPEYSEPTT